MKEPDSLSEAKSKGDEFKEVADENDVTEEQFYACFSDINCNLGLEAKKEMFNCYSKPLEEEMKKYIQWFKECPVGTFSEYTVKEINDVFCEMNAEDQRTLNDFFLEESTKHIKEYCEKGGNEGRCDRMRAGAVCSSELLERYIAEGKCKTIVNEVPKPPMER
ncbi:uncharacterized protein CEXT_481881 [Caerostris extrusa]|uniref:Uncharacterized protein n=1 Tax=Caerostris extrusa TaxID=172846 RepID=A0AAV4UF19_CAEEX|nr:uncharacterized protein CEXT_481881 [Caerostris extrusa]